MRPPDRLWLATLVASMVGCSGEKPHVDGAWRVSVVERAESGIRVPSNQRLAVEYGLLPMTNKPEPPSPDSVTVWPLRTTAQHAVVFRDGVLRDPTGAIVGGDGTYLIDGDTVLISGPQGTRALRIERLRNPWESRGARLWRELRNGPLVRLSWADSADRLRIVLLRAGAVGVSR